MMPGIGKNGTITKPYRKNLKTYMGSAISRNQRK